MAKEKQEAVPQEQKPYDPMQDKVSITLPRATGSEEDTLFVGLNGKGYNIKRGVPVMVPRPVAAIIRERERMIDRQYAFQDELEALKRSGH